MDVRLVLYFVLAWDAVLLRRGMVRQSFVGGAAEVTDAFWRPSMARRRKLQPLGGGRLLSITILIRLLADVDFETLRLHALDCLLFKIGGGLPLLLAAVRLNLGFIIGLFLHVVLVVIR